MPKGKVQKKFHNKLLEILINWIKKGFNTLNKKIADPIYSELRGLKKKGKEMK